MKFNLDEKAELITIEQKLYGCADFQYHVYYFKNSKSVSVNMNYFITEVREYLHEIVSRELKYVRLRGLE